MPEPLTPEQRGDLRRWRDDDEEWRIPDSELGRTVAQAVDLLTEDGDERIPGTPWSEDEPIPLPADQPTSTGVDLPLPRWLMELAEDPLQHQHVAIVTDTSVTIRHPLIERRDFDLEGCDALQRAIVWVEQRSPHRGRYIVHDEDPEKTWLEALQ